MLAAVADPARLRFPLMASPKLDGIRASVIGGKLLSRTLKRIPNLHIYEALSDPRHEGFDGELIIGDPTDDDAYRNTVSGVMSIAGEPTYTWHVFDLHDVPKPFGARLGQLRVEVSRAKRTQIVVHAHETINTPEELDDYEKRVIAEGYEGLILRDPLGAYKYGRSTVREGGMLKLKRFEDSEAIVLGMLEEMHNGNEAETNELGRTKRSTALAGLTGKGTMGALCVRDIYTEQVFNIGTGFTASERLQWWYDQNLHIGKTVVKYKHFPIGVKDAPRHPVFIGIRDERDL